MSTHRFLGPENIVIDTCVGCKLIWLDYGELSKVINAPGRDRGVPKSDQAEFEWEKAEKKMRKKGKKKQNNLEIDLLDLLDDILS